ncbi:hypothetical protein SAMN05421676_103145 [Salinibacillus kushneri]|uniref:N-acetyltransferase domain-containing protein n=1 Tax=Salinibacillus kushneri TaxID=237682 RepID=A0A1I0CEQ2_9BACI|nr:GNAT family N-acetyltransferase [Salinibacillus kushneri]SET18051.1 hypothetical protein SAMN05421676_103145 [Salinibacillus kushneri]
MDLFNIITNQKEYWLVDQIKKENVGSNDYQKQFSSILNDWIEERIGYLSLLMDENQEEWLMSKGFEKISSIVEYIRSLDSLPDIDEEMDYHSLSEGSMSDQEFRLLYDRCRTGTLNKNKQQSMDKVMHAIETELGPNWRKHCYYFTKSDSLLGICIPHIEMGTNDEGRLFYFGVTPEFRGQGTGVNIHKIALHLLKNHFSAKNYVGSTDTSNQPMIKIFEQNGCQLRDRKGIYRIEKEN